ncbi:MAG TPA: pyridoxamine 5'-phosphate oxidase [Vicinamibacterales bacterium]|nr:pyridoxamine 5'-phosphate oxidase [Vicinamibacterales bacterium]
MTSLAELRREYASRALTDAEALDDPIQQFSLWFGEALKSELLDVNAMTLATVSPDGAPAARIVLLKGFDEKGFVFFTNYGSAKARELEQNPRACLLLFWPELERQVRVTGRVTKTSAEESEKYFQSRPFESQIGAWASAQSQTIADRAALEARYAELAAKYAGGPVPVPPFWGGYRVAAGAIEFWQGRKSRLHDRLLYTRQGSAWARSRLAP